MIEAERRELDPRKLHLRRPFGERAVLLQRRFISKVHAGVGDDQAEAHQGILRVDPCVFWRAGEMPFVKPARSSWGGHEIVVRAGEGRTAPCRSNRGGVVNTMKWRPVVWFLLAALAVTAAHVSAQPRRTITLWYPAGDIAAGPRSPFTDPNLFAPFEATNNVKIEMVGLGYENMVQKIFAAAAGRNIADILFIHQSWLPGFLKEDLLQQMDSAKARKWLADVVPDVVDLSDYGSGTMWGYPQMGYDIYGLTWNKARSEEHTSELQSLAYLVCRLLLEKKKCTITCSGVL